ncbi:putative quinol monooxygenase [Promicromonospora sukumoe]|uniref:putative quinol monooxygenase n=1 Tax=Promicromonospora sukumoe TaxID=88382 RepID=UPI0037CC8B9D
MSGQFGLYVRHTLKEGAAEAFDQLVATAAEGIRQEPGTLVYVSHTVDGQPNLRVFYELYRDREAFDEHERQEHTRHFLAEREALVDSIEVDWLTSIIGKAPQ